MSKALQHCGYEAKDTEDGGFEMKLTTPYEGATIRADIWQADPLVERTWRFYCHVMNNRGFGWSVRGEFDDCGRFVAKGMLRSMALEMRRAYCHRGQKVRKRAIARAKAKAEAGKGGAE